LQGKSLSIICGALRWLKDHLTREKIKLENGIEELKKQESLLEKESDWINGQSRKLELQRNRIEKQEQLKLIIDQSEEIEKMKERVAKQVCVVSYLVVSYSRPSLNRPRINRRPDLLPSPERK
jgi:chromosome transmission fidelity protein 1